MARAALRRTVIAVATAIAGGFGGLVLAVEGGWPLAPVTLGAAVLFGAFAWWQRGGTG